MNRIWKVMAILSLEAALISSPQAALIDRGGGLIYDTDLNVTWLQDVGYARTTGYTADGVHVDDTNYSQIMHWQAAYDWAHNLTYYDSVRNVTYSDWRLPKAFLPHPTAPTCNGGNCVDSELGHLWYVELGNEFLGVGVSTGRNGGPFINDEYLYWIWTETFEVGDWAWAFRWSTGESELNQRSVVYNTAWAVRDGDVAQVTSTVAEPGGLLLLGIALSSLALTSRRRAHYARKLAIRT